MPPVPASADEAFAYIEQFVNLERGGYKPREYRLERMARLLSAFGRPQDGISTVHIAGSKGKGSTASFVEAGLRSLGLKTGLYASPHISDYRERFRIDGLFAADNDIVAETARIYEHVEPLRSHPDAVERLPTTFELLTLLAFLLFRRARCDWIVLETGLGGRLDATNLCRPDLCLITPIELEHTEYLGTDLTSIAREKAGIFKEGVPVLLSRQSSEAERELLRVAATRHCQVRRFDEEVHISDIRVDSGGTRAMVTLTRETNRFEMHLNLTGTAQAENAALALVAVLALRPDADLERVLAGLREARLPGRAEFVRGRPPLLLDGAHTAGSVRRLMQTAQSVLPPYPVILFGAVRGKDIGGMIAELSGRCRSVVVSRAGTFKPSDPDEIARAFSEHGFEVDLATEPDEAVALARARAGSGGGIVVTGSFYLVSAVRAVLNAEGDL